MCHADPPRYDYPGGPNYGKPCSPVAGLYDGKPIMTCRFCGRKLEG